MLKDKIKKMVSVVALGALLTVGVSSIKSMATTATTPQIIPEITIDGLESDYNNFEYDYAGNIKEMLDAGYIDQAKADSLIKAVDSEEGKVEIYKTYELFRVDSLIKEGSYSEELGNLEKQLIEADYSGNDELYDQLNDKYTDLFFKESLTNVVKEMLDAGFINQAKADALISGIGSEGGQTEIFRNYDLYLVDLSVKEGDITEELGNLEKQLIEAEYAGNDALADELSEKFWNQLSKLTLTDIVKEMSDAGYIDQAKANTFMNGIDSESVQTEIYKAYDLYSVDLSVKEGYITEEIADLERQLIEADYSGDDNLYNEIFEKYYDKLQKEGLLSQDVSEFVM